MKLNITIIAQIPGEMRAALNQFFTTLKKAFAETTQTKLCPAALKHMRAYSFETLGNKRFVNDNLIVMFRRFRARVLMFNRWRAFWPKGYQREKTGKSNN